LNFQGLLVNKKRVGLCYHDATDIGGKIIIDSIGERDMEKADDAQPIGSTVMATSTAHDRDKTEAKCIVVSYLRHISGGGVPDKSIIARCR
jgi:hypothetical protein